MAYAAAFASSVHIKAFGWTCTVKRLERYQLGSALFVTLFSVMRTGPPLGWSHQLLGLKRMAPLSFQPSAYDSWDGLQQTLVPLSSGRSEYGRGTNDRSFSYSDLALKKRGEVVRLPFVSFSVVWLTRGQLNHRQTPRWLLLPIGRAYAAAI